MKDFGIFLMVVGAGFSPAVMKGVLAAKMDDFTPEAIMRSTVNIDRYNW